MTKVRTGLKAMLLTALLALPAATATSYLELDLDTIVERAEIAFFGTVEAVEVEARAGDPWTVVTFAVTDPFAGTEADEEIRLSFLGGTLPNGASLSVNLMPRFEVGEQVLVMAYRDEAYSPLVGFRQGLWRLGELGFRDEAGRLLSLDEEGAVVADGPGAATAEVLAALSARFEGEP